MNKVYHADQKNTSAVCLKLLIIFFHNIVIELSK